MSFYCATNMDLRIFLSITASCAAVCAVEHITIPIHGGHAGWATDNSSNEIVPAALSTDRAVETYVMHEHFKKALVDAHNQARSIVQPTATNMKKMSWDNELEKVATDYSKMCLFSHSKHASHSRFTVGENIYITQGRAVDDIFMRHAVTLWDNEKADYNYATRFCPSGKMCGHYTQVVWAESFKVGCGVTLCSSVMVRKKVWTNAKILICNYGPAGNIQGQFPYKSGRPCADCHSKDTCVNNLCTNPVREALLPPSPCWSEWAQWSQCSATCGRSSRKRDRFCNTFVPGDCWGRGVEVENYCTPNICGSTNTKFGDWEAWSECTVSCGVGRRTRKRSCLQGWCRDPAGYTEYCNTHPCSTVGKPQCSGSSPIPNFLQFYLMPLFIIYRFFFI